MKIRYFENCKTIRTGLYKPHTIYLNQFLHISIVYYDRENANITKKIAIATDTNNNKYEIYETKSIYGNIGFLAFPVNPENIYGFYPWQ